MIVFALPNPFSQWPFTGAGFETRLFERPLGNDESPRAALQKLGGGEGDLFLFDLNLVPRLPGYDTRKDDHALPEAYAQYLASVRRHLMNFGRTDLAFGERPSKGRSICFMPTQQATSKWMTPTLVEIDAAVALSLFHEVRFESPPHTAAAARASMLVSAPRPGQMDDPLSPNPFANPDRLELTHEIRRKLRDLVRQLSAINAEEHRFERNDLISLMRQTLVTLGENGEVPASGVRAIPQAGLDLSTRLEKAEKSIAHGKSLYKTAKELYEFIISLWPW